jgi:hypothetical protein
MAITKKLRDVVETVVPGLAGGPERATNDIAIVSEKFDVLQK